MSEPRTSHHLGSLLLRQELPEAPGSRMDASQFLQASATPVAPRTPDPTPPPPPAALTSFLLPEFAQSTSRPTPPSVKPQRAPGSTPPLPSSILNALVQAPTPPTPPLSAPSLPIPSLPTLLPALASLAGRIAAELENAPQKLLTLNRTRRAAVAEYLDRLAGTAPASLSPSAAGASKSLDPLLRWIHQPKSPAQNLALKTYFEEVAWLALAQALVLKSWSDHGIRKWSESDLADMSWSLSTTLKPYVPLDREGWHITRGNIYCWYKPEPSLQREIWRSLESWKISDEGPDLLAALLKHPRQSDPDARELRGYDSRFFKAIWEQVEALGIGAHSPSFLPGLERKRSAFTPTLRSGAFTRSSPECFDWIGFESHPFQLMVAELIQLWWGPAAPPTWAPGTGLEAHSREQLSLLSGSPKPSLIQRIAEMEACDLAFVLEERALRLSQRNAEAAQFRNQVDQLPYFKNIKTPGTSLGTLQACVALSKLRPGGLLWWSREEPLRAQEGTPALNFLLERGKLICEWDLSALEHSLPSAAPLFPKYLYLWVRESDFQGRLNHRPCRVSVQGQIRSHIELPIFLNDVLSAARNPRSTPQRSNWQILLQQSPTLQKEWMERWPEATDHQTLRKMDELRASSAPLATLATIRATPVAAPGTKGWKLSEHSLIQGLWIHWDAEGRGKLKAQLLPRPGTEVSQSGFLIGVRDATWVAPLLHYLSSDGIAQWLHHHADRKGDRIVLTEQQIKFLPIPKTLIQSWGALGSGDSPTERKPSLSPEWELLLSELLTPGGPSRLFDRLLRLPPGQDHRALRAAVFTRTSQTLEHQRQTSERIRQMVTPSGTIRWREILRILPASESIPAPLHPELRVLGQLPPHLPIGRIDRIRTPAPGVMLATETGMHLQLLSEDTRLVEMIVEQLEGVRHATWSEISQLIRLPRRIEVAMGAAQDILRAHGEQLEKERELQKLLSVTLEF